MNERIDMWSVCALKVHKLLYAEKTRRSVYCFFMKVMQRGHFSGQTEWNKESVSLFPEWVARRWQTQLWLIQPAEPPVFCSRKKECIKMYESHRLAMIDTTSTIKSVIILFYNCCALFYNVQFEPRSYAVRPC